MPNYIKEIGIQSSTSVAPTMYHVNSDTANFVNDNTRSLKVTEDHKYTVAKYTSAGAVTLTIPTLKRNQEVYAFLINTSTSDISVTFSVPPGQQVYYSGLGTLTSGNFTIEKNSLVEVSAICLSNGTTNTYFIRIA